MFNKQNYAAAMAVALLLILVPAPSRAASWNRAPLPRPAASLLTKLERWWNQFLNGPERPSDSESWRKNGCGMDPNGVCDPGTTQVAPADSSGSGTN